MKAKELRIGNYVSSWRINDTWQIKRIESGKEIDFIFMQEESIIYKPIPLTEEWLIKLSPQIKDLGNSIFRVGRFKFIWKFSYKYWYVVDDMCGAYMTKIEFVHEYQNFWFAMNNEELKLASDSAQF